MSAVSKRMRAIGEKYERDDVHHIDAALKLLKEVSQVKFPESVDVAVRLGIDTRKSDQTVRGSTVLPKGIGKKVRVAVFAQGENAEKALAAGADIVGYEDLAKTIQEGNLDFDTVIATPDAMRVVGKLGQILGPRGLMPNPKVGTVSTDVELAVKNAKAGQVRYRADKGGIVHCTIGKLSFEIDDLKANLRALLADLHKAKPAAAKGVYLRKLSVSSTMGPGLTVDHENLD